MLDVTHEGMTLTWQPPEDNGGSTITGYIIERKEARSDRWLRINKNYVTMTRYRSSGLIEGLEYEHRITAVNSRGAGKPSESSAITVAMDPIGTCCLVSLLQCYLIGFIQLTLTTNFKLISLKIFVFLNRAAWSSSSAQSNRQHQDFSLSCLVAT